MNEQTIIDLTFKAGAKLHSEPPTRQVTGVFMSFESMQMFAQLIAAAEREACAKVAERFEPDERARYVTYPSDAIRARGEK